MQEENVMTTFGRVFLIGLLGVLSLAGPARMAAGQQWQKVERAALPPSDDVSQRSAAGGLVEPLESKISVLRRHMAGVHGAVVGGLEIIAQDTRLRYRSATGPADEPYREIALPGVVTNLAASSDMVYVWTGELFLTGYPLTTEGLGEGRPLPMDYPEAVRAFERRFDPLQPSGQADAVPRHSADISPQKLFVANSGTTTSAAGIGPDSVSVIDTNTNRLLANVAFQSGDAPADILVRPDNSAVLVALYGCDTCSARGIGSFDPATHALQPKFSSTGWPNRMIQNQSGSKIFTADDGRVRAYDASTKALLGSTVNTGFPIYEIVLSADERRLVGVGASTSQNKDLLFAVDTDTMTVTKAWSMTPASGAVEVIYGPDGKLLYVSLLAMRKIMVVDVDTAQISKYLDSGAIGAMQLSPDKQKLFATRLDTNTFEVLDPLTAARTSQVPVGVLPVIMVINRSTTRVYVANMDSNSVTAIDLSGGAPSSLATIAVGPEPWGMDLSYSSAAGSLTVTPLQLAFNATAGQSSVPSQTLALSGTGTFTASAATQSGGSWLRLSQTGGTLPATLTVSVDVTGLAAGDYSGSVTITAGATTQRVTVSLRITGTAAGSLTVTPVQLAFNATAGQSSVPSQNLALSGTGTFTASAATQSGGSWLRLSPTGGTLPATLAVSVDVTGLAAGDYSGSVTITAGTTTQRVTVSLRITAVTVTGTVSYDGPTATRVTLGATVNIAVTVTNTGSATLNSVWLGLDIATAAGRTIDSAKSPSNTAGRIDFGSAQGQNLASKESRTFSAGFTFDASRYEAGAYKYLFWAWQNGYPGSGATPITSLQEVALTITPRPCGAVDPDLSVELAPGFYIAALGIQAAGTGGYWEMGVEPRKDKQAGGFIFGGGVQERGATPYFSAFSVAGQQQVTIQLNPRVLPGGDPKQFSACARLLNAQRQQVGADVCSVGYIEFRQVLPEGFYIVEVRTGAASPRAYFEMSLSGSQLAPSLIVGGFAAQDVGSFVAFTIADPQEVRVNAAGQNTFGSFGASCLQLTLFDAARNVIRTVP
jgi:YVTN family beta-propeller protein